MKTISVVSFGLACLLSTAAIAAGEAAKPAAAPAPAAAAAPTPAPAAEAKPAAAAPSAAAVAAGKKIDWDKMDVNAKKKYMKATVLPTMKKLFVAVDKKKYSAMNCATCHGKEAADRKFKMPSPELPKLPQPTDRAGFMALQQKKPEVVKFMGTEVKPTMAALLGKPEWQPNNPEGFGCYGCHSKEEAAAAPTPPPGVAPAPKPGAAAPAPAAKPGAPAAPPAPAGKGW
jgi:pyruvate dehydrogenase E2 component (dihydrolipoyllysine-residue acetyltransferase)